MVCSGGKQVSDALAYSSAVQLWRKVESRVDVCRTALGTRLIVRKRGQFAEKRRPEEKDEDSGRYVCFREAQSVHEHKIPDGNISRTLYYTNSKHRNSLTLRSVTKLRQRSDTAVFSDAVSGSSA